MKSGLLTWRVLLQGESVESLVIAAREQATAELGKLLAIEAEVKKRVAEEMARAAQSGSG